MRSQSTQFRACTTGGMASSPLWRQQAAPICSVTSRCEGGSLASCRVQSMCAFGTLRVRATPNNSVKRTPVQRLRSSIHRGRRRLLRALAPTRNSDATWGAEQIRGYSGNRLDLPCAWVSVGCRERAARSIRWSKAGVAIGYSPSAVGSRCHWHATQAAMGALSVRLLFYHSANWRAPRHISRRFHVVSAQTQQRPLHRCRACALTTRSSGRKPAARVAPLTSGVRFLLGGWHCARSALQR